MDDLCGVILAGGDGGRLGRDKARLFLGREPVLVRLVRLLSDLCPEVLVAIGKRRRLGFRVATPLVEDLLPGRGPLSGLHAGLSYASRPLCLVVACDMPFLSPKLLARLCQAASPGRTVAFRIRGYIEPFPGLYPKGLLPQVEEAIRTGELGVQALFRRVPHLLLPEGEARAADPQLLSFVNVNTPGDLDGLVEGEREAP